MKNEETLKRRKEESDEEDVNDDVYKEETDTKNPVAFEKVCLYCLKGKMNLKCK